MTAPEIIITVFGAIAVACSIVIVCIYRDNPRPAGRHVAHVIPGYDPEPGDEWSPAAEWGDTVSLGYDVENMTTAELEAGVLGIAREVAKRDRLDDLTDRFHAAPVDVAVPALPPSPLADPPTGTATTTRLHAVEIHPVQKWAAKAWETVATPMQRQLVWQQHEPPADRGDYSESAWTKREGTQLAILLAEEALDGFDQLTREVRNFGAYATSGLQQRWAS